MRKRANYRAQSNSLLPVLLISACLSPTTLLAQDASPVDQPTLAELERMKAQIERQKQQLSGQIKQLADQQRVINSQAQQIDRMINRLSPQNSIPEMAVPPDAKQARSAQAPSQTKDPDTPVGQRAEAEQAERRTTTDIPIFADIGGVLTPRGQFALEPRVDYTHSGVTRFFFQGVEIVDVVLVGLFELTDADRNTLTNSLTARYGITDRFEIDAEVSYLFRNDRITNEAVSLDNQTLVRDLSGNGVGDAEIGLHYQLNRAGRGSPVFVANFRAKSDLGEGPFEIARDQDGLELELPVGSGFWTLEPSMTMLYTLDPAVLFFNTGYLFNMAKDVNAQIGDTIVSRVNPGDSIRAGFGIGVGLNETLSFSLGYEHNYVLGTKTRIEQSRFKTNSLHVGSFLFGLSLALTDNLGLNLSTQLGVTDDAPDMRISLRLPIRF